MKEQLASLGVSVLQALSPALLALLGWIGVKIAALIQAKVKNVTMQGILTRLDDTVLASVKEVEQTFVSNLKDGKPDDFAKAKQMALDSIKSHMGTKGMGELKTVLGLDDPAALEKFIVTMLESKVHDVSQAGGAK